MSGVQATAVQGPSDELESQVEPITCMMIGGGALITAKFLTDWWDRRRGGLIIERAEDGTFQVRRSGEVPYGYVIVLPQGGGEVEIHVKDSPRDATERLLTELLTSSLVSTTEVAQLAGDFLSVVR